MPVRRSFNPQPMNRPEILPHGQAQRPPNLQPAPEPLPPRQGPPQDPNAMAMGPTSMGAQLPASIPLRPPVPPMPQPQRQPNATVTPMNAPEFLSAEAGTASGPDPGDNRALLKLLSVLGHTGAPDDAAT